MLKIFDIVNAKFKPSEQAAEWEKYVLYKCCGLTYRYEPARIAIGYSLGCIPKTGLHKSPKKYDGKEISGKDLFEKDKIELWVICLVQWANRKLDNDQFRELVQFHWDRGASELLKLKATNDSFDSPEQFFHRLLVRPEISNLSQLEERSAGKSSTSGSADLIKISLGEISIDNNQKEIQAEINRAGSPHIAIMGGTGSGKTRTALHILKTLAQSNPGLPFLFLDPKGQFVAGDTLSVSPDFHGTLADQIPDIAPLNPFKNPIPLNFLYRAENLSSQELEHTISAFVTTFFEATPAKDNAYLQQQALTNTVRKLLQGQNQKINFREILDTYAENIEKFPDGASIFLEKLARSNLFSPEQEPATFFNNRHVIGLNEIDEANKNLVSKLILECLKTYILSQQDSALNNGCRSLKWVLVIDEAHTILKKKQPALERLLRESRSKGLLIILIAQSPDDFAQHGDLLAQAGTVIIFQCQCKNTKGLSGIFNNPKPSDFNATSLKTGQAKVKANNFSGIVQCFR